MDNIEEITKRVEDTQKEVVVKEDNVKIAPTEPGRQYSSMTMPMTQLMMKLRKRYKAKSTMPLKTISLLIKNLVNLQRSVTNS